jgi:hypothetical protein
MLLDVADPITAESNSRMLLIESLLNINHHRREWNGAWPQLAIIIFYFQNLFYTFEQCGGHSTVTFQRFQFPSLPLFLETKKRRNLFLFSNEKKKKNYVHELYIIHGKLPEDNLKFGGVARLHESKI